MDRADYKALMPYCATDEQREKLELCSQLGQRGAARELGLSRGTISNMVERIRGRAAMRGYSPDDDAAGMAPPGFTVKGKSTLHGPDGSVKLQWVKTQKDAARSHEILLEELEDASERIRGLAKPAQSPSEVREDLIAIYPYGDPHLGLYAWGGPQGDAEDHFDLDRGVELLYRSTCQLVESVPPAGQALICFLGDFFHADNQNNTTRSGHQLDVDSRWAKVFRAGVNCAIALIRTALEKHATVHVVVEIGNHDTHSALALAVALDLFFEQETRVTVDQSARRHHYHRFGKNLIGIHHGDLTKPVNLPGVMAADRPQDWGETAHRAWYTGHIHTQTRYEYPGCEVESFAILPPGDAWTNSMGYRAKRSMDCIVRHHDRGEIARHTVYAADC